MAERRVAYAAVVDGVLTLGHPRGTHVRLTPDGIEVTVRESGEDCEWGAAWTQIEEIAVETSAASTRRPALAAGLLAAVSAALGLDEFVPEVPTTVKVVVDGAARSIICMGYVGRGYRSDHLAALDRLLMNLPAHADAQARLSTPDEVLQEMLK